jgi:hypothetical protein
MWGSGGWSSRRRLGASYAAGRVVGAPSARPGLTSRSAFLSSRADLGSNTAAQAPGPMARLLLEIRLGSPPPPSGPPCRRGRLPEPGRPLGNSPLRPLSPLALRLSARTPPAESRALSLASPPVPHASIPPASCCCCDAQSRFRGRCWCDVGKFAFLGPTHCYCQRGVVFPELRLDP